jgi:hypothetical protein
MHVLLRITGIVIVIGLLTIGIFGIRYACYPRDLLSVIHRAEEVEQLHQAMLRRQESQNQAAQEWMTQRCTWEETMQRLRELDQEMDQAWPGYSRMVGESTKLSAEERHYQFIFHYVTTVPRGRPEELAVVLRRLEKDSQQLHSGSPKPGTASQDAGVRRSGTVQESAGASSSPP